MADPDAVPLSAAVEIMRRGGALLKAGRRGKPHFRQFQLSEDLTKIQWASPQKKVYDSKVELAEVSELRLGQNTKVFSSNPIPEHEDLSFSLIYSGGNRSLDIVCKDRREFHIWTTGLTALINGELDIEEFLANAPSLQIETSDSMRVTFSGKKTIVDKREDASDLYSWGEGSKGRLGHGSDADCSIPQVVEALLGNDISLISCGPSHTAAVSVSGQLYTWGAGGSGRLGHGHERDRVTPLMVAGLRHLKVVNISCGDFHTGAVTEEGRLYTWGKGADFRLGYESTKQLEPAPVEGALADVEVASVVCSSNFSAAVSRSGRVYTWGSGEKGQLGHGDEEDAEEPRIVEALAETSIMRVAAGVHHMAAMSARGAMWTWGEGAGGKLGHNSTDDVHLPTRVDALSNATVMAVAAGANHTVCLTAENRVFSWGEGTNGQLGLGPSTGQTVPTEVTGFEGRTVVNVGCGSQYTIAHTEDGQIYAWGLNLNGQLGVGDSMNRNTPSLVAQMLDKKIRTIACGGNHVAATVIHGWVRDEEVNSCMACKSKFTIVRRRHHCRNCGGIFCGSCSSKKFVLLSAGFSDPVRVCDKCHSILSNAK